MPNKKSNRGFGAMDEEQQKEISRKGGESSGSERGGSRNQGSSERGFAAMDPEEQRRISSEGGKASHEKGTGHEWDSEEAREAGRKGGQSSGGGNRNQ
jgi:general stress protein YciG